MKSRSYAEMRSFSTFEDRFEYLSLKGTVGHSTFGFERWMNQSFYTSRQWRSLRQHIIARDLGCDLGVDGYQIGDNVKLIIHHINPMSPSDFENDNPSMLDENNLITTTHDTHNAIHYGDRTLLRTPFVERRPGDTLLWERRN